MSCQKRLELERYHLHAYSIRCWIFSTEKQNYQPMEFPLVQDFPLICTISFIDFYTDTLLFGEVLFTHTTTNSFYRELFYHEEEGKKKTQAASESLLCEINCCFMS